MRFVTGHAGIEAGNPPVPQGWRRINAPRPWVSYLLAGVAGVVLISVLLGVLIATSLVTADFDVSDVEAPTPWGAVVVALIGYIPLHEVLHAAGHPGCGLSLQTVMVIWPARLRFGVYYAGCMSRRRWLWMRAAPLVFLSSVPAALLILSYLVPMSNAWLVFLQVLLLVNGLGAGGDVVAMLLVRQQVPAEAQICFLGGRAYWRAR